MVEISSHYPFSALVGQDDMSMALLLIAVNPAIGGVLIRGQKGTGKSTAARGLAALLPEVKCASGCPFPFSPEELPNLLWREPAEDVEARPAAFVDLPLGATEDRVLGALDLERALQHGERRFEPGLLAEAHRGILYIDEVNLLSDHLVDVLLDAAAMGVNVVEREGMSVSHPARFILVGTMNAEEGDLRPQLLDRFGLTVEVTAPGEPVARMEIMRRRLAYEADSTGFAIRFQQEERALREQIDAARANLEAVELTDEILALIADICLTFDADGMRADLVIHKTACTLAAWEGRTQVRPADVRRAAELALPHRRRQPFEQPRLNQGELEDLVDNYANGNRSRHNAREPKTDKEGDS